MAVVGLWRRNTLVLVLCALFCARLTAADLNKPNEIITEIVVGFDKSPDQAEKEALELASTRTINGDYESKAVWIDLGDGVFYCQVLIQHKIYTEPTQTKNQQATIGYGSNCERAYEEALSKAEKIINESSRSIAKINDKKDDRAQSRNRTAAQQFWVKGTTFEKLGSTWTCIIKFEYLKDKDTD
jgi:hypothetical protein